MENCTVYSHQLEFDKVVQIVKSHLPKANVDVTDDGLQKSLTATVKGGLFGKDKTLKINYRQRLNPSYTLGEAECGLTKNLTGMIGFVQSLPAQNETVRSKFVHKVMSVNAEMPFMAEPEITPEFAAVLRQIMTELDAFAFAPPGKLFTRSGGQHFVDKDFRLILDTAGNSEITDLEVNVNAKYHDAPAESYTAGQLERKARSEAFLNENGIKTNTHLPCVPDAATVRIRTAQEITERAYCLLVVAARGEGIAQDHVEKIVFTQRIIDFSPKESDVYAAETLSDRERAYATWRYESLYVMLWALGQVPELKYPGEICDVPALVDTILTPTREEFESSILPKSGTEILDELDKIYRMHWACVDARIKGQPAPEGLEPGVVYERHYSLNWLTHDGDHDWDDIQTHT